MTCHVAVVCYSIVAVDAAAARHCNCVHDRLATVFSLLAEESFAWSSLDSDWGTDAALPGDRWGASLTCIADKQVGLLGLQLHSGRLGSLH